MLKYGNRDFRNLQEQVYANMKNIEDIIKGQDIIADYTLQIVGQVDSAEELPDAETYDGKLGDIYVVGEASPFHGYAFVKVYENENVPRWVDLGAILVQGPKGEQGPKGDTGETGAQGPQGDQGVPAGFGVPTASIQGTTGIPNVSITASGPNTAKVFDFTFYNLKGETGAQGPAGRDGKDGLGVPEIQSGDAGKALIVNADETGAIWSRVPAEIIKLNFNGSDTLNISDELYNKLFTTGSENVIIYAYNTSTNPSGSAFYTHKTTWASYQQVTQNTHPSSTTILSGYIVSQSQKYQIDTSGTYGSRKLTISAVSNKYFIDRIALNYNIIVSFTDNSGTRTGYTSKFYPEALASFNLYYVLSDGPDTTRYIPLHVLEYNFNKNILAEGRNATNKYTLKWHLPSGSYTVTTTAIQ